MYIEKGVRQGGILSPLLFKLYVDNLISDIAKKNVGCQLGLLRLNIIAYADDLVILADTVEHLEYLYGILDEGIRNLKLLMNKTKSKCMIFQKTNSKERVKEIRLGNDAFEVVSDYKYLGHVVNRQLLLMLEPNLTVFMRSLILFLEILRMFLLKPFFSFLMLIFSQIMV